MNKLALVFAFSFVAAYTPRMSKEDERDQYLMSLAKNICAENMIGCRRDILHLAQNHSDEQIVQGCIYSALSDFENLFGEARTYTLLGEAGSRTNCKKFADEIHSMMAGYQSVHDQWVSACREASEFFSRMTLNRTASSFVFRPEIGVKYFGGDPDAHYMTPSQFLNRRPPIIKNLLPIVPPQAT